MDPVQLDDGGDEVDHTDALSDNEDEFQDLFGPSESNDCPKASFASGGDYHQNDGD